MNRKARLVRYQSLIDCAKTPDAKVAIAAEYFREALAQAPADVAAVAADVLVRDLLAEVGQLERLTPKSPPRPRQLGSFLPPRDPS